MACTQRGGWSVPNPHPYSNPALDGGGCFTPPTGPLAPRKDQVPLAQIVVPMVGF